MTMKSGNNQPFEYTHAAAVTAAASTYGNALISPATNVNGMIVQSVQLVTSTGATGEMSIVAKSTAPTGTRDGDVLLLAGPSNWMTSGPVSLNVKIAAGKGLYLCNGDGSVSIKGQAFAKAL